MENLQKFPELCPEQEFFQSETKSENLVKITQSVKNFTYKKFQFQEKKGKRCHHHKYGRNSKKGNNFVSRKKQRVQMAVKSKGGAPGYSPQILAAKHILFKIFLFCFPYKQCYLTRCGHLQQLLRNLKFLLLVVMMMSLWDLLD